MNKELIDKILKDWIGGPSKKEALIRIFEKVRDIPYGVIGTRNPEQVYLKNMGTCSGKHFLFFELATNLKFQVKHFVCSHKFSQLKANFPPQIQDILKNNDVLDYHNFVKVFTNNRWVLIDLTWDSPLKRYGFSIQEYWDGKSDTSIGVMPIEVWETENPTQFKEDKLALTTKKDQEVRMLFLQKLSEWFSTLR